MEDAEENLEMIPLYEEALELSKEIYGEHNLKTLEIYNNYGGHLRNLGLYEKAEHILRKAVVCAKIVRGKEHPDYATTLVNLANLLRMMKQWQESECLFYQALALYKITIGEEHFIYAGNPSFPHTIITWDKTCGRALPLRIHNLHEIPC